MVSEVADDEEGAGELGKIEGVSEDVAPDEGDELGKLVGVPEIVDEGDELDKLVGASEGIEVGAELGNLDGIFEEADGAELGVIVGATEEFNVATDVGMLEGTMLDRRLGWKLGRTDGAELGRGLRRIITLSMTTLCAPPPRCNLYVSAFAMFSSILQTPEIVFQPSGTNSDDVRNTIALIVCKRFLEGSEVK